jgi:DNA-binding transcriptional ArsR family regulator
VSNLDALAKLLGAVGHPTRLRIPLALLRDGEASPRAISTRLGLTLGVVAHHVRGLARGGVIRQTRTRRVRGAEEHFYVLTSNALDLLEKLDLVGAGERED